MSYLLPLIAALPLAATDDLAWLLRDGNRQSRESIHSINLKMEIFHPARPGPVPIFAGGAKGSNGENRVEIDWWQSADCIRRHERYDDGTMWDSLLKDGTYKALSSHPRKKGKPYLSGHLAADHSVLSGNPWQCGLFDLWGTSAVPVTALLDSPNFENIVVQKDNRGRTVYKVAFRYEGERGEAWFDPRYNFLVRKIVTQAADGNSRSESEVMAFREVKSGIFFPESIERRYYSKTQNYVTEIEKFTDVRVNESIDPSIFQLAFPPGTAVGDEIKGLSYVTGDNEQPANKPSPLAAGNSDPIQFPTGLGPPPSRHSGLIIAAVLTPLLLLGIWIYWSKFRQKAVE